MTASRNCKEESLPRMQHRPVVHAVGLWKLCCFMCEVHHYPPKEMAADVGALDAASSGHTRWHRAAAFRRLSGSGWADAFDRLPGRF